MKTSFSYSDGAAPLFLTFLALLILINGCATPNPVEGWKCHDANLDPPNLTNDKAHGYYSPDEVYHIDKAVLDDYANFVEELKRRYPALYLSEVDFCEDGTGQHAVKLTVEVDLREYKEYYLMYNKTNVRTKVIEGRSGHQFHI